MEKLTNFFKFFLLVVIFFASSFGFFYVLVFDQDMEIHSIVGYCAGIAFFMIGVWCQEMEWCVSADSIPLESSRMGMWFILFAIVSLVLFFLLDIEGSVIYRIVHSQINNLAVTVPYYAAHTVLGVIVSWIDMKFIFGKVD
jgi:hypothetical protein